VRRTWSRRKNSTRLAVALAVALSIACGLGCAGVRPTFVLHCQTSEERADAALVDAQWDAVSRAPGNPYENFLDYVDGLEAACIAVNTIRGESL
jgi:hypothetical protein